MRIKAELQVLDEPVRPVDPTGLTAEPDLTGPETGLTAQSAENADSVAKKTEDQDWRVPIISYLLKCLDSDQTKVAMGEVYEGICGTH